MTAPDGLVPAGVQMTLEDLAPADVAKRRRHEAPEVGAMVGRMLNALIRRAGEGDQEAVEELAALESLARHAMTAGLAAARDHYSLAELAAVTGTTRQAVSQRTKARPIQGAPCGTHPTCVGMKRCRESGRNEA